MTKKTKSVLGDCFYVLEAGENGSCLVYKVTGDNTRRPDPYVVNDALLCSCKAGEHGRECKHSKIAERSLVGNEVEWKTAKRLVDQWLRSVKAQWPDTHVESLLDHREPTETINIAHALVAGEDVCERERLTLWMELGPLLVVIHSFRDVDRCERALRSYKRKQKGSGRWSKKSVPRGRMRGRRRAD